MLNLRSMEKVLPCLMLILSLLFAGPAAEAEGGGWYG